MRWALLLCLVGCDARFVDLRPATSSLPDLASTPDLVSADLGEVDLAPVGVPPDLAQPIGVFARGTFMGRAGHGGSGTATLERKSDGTVELVFGADFTVTGVPGPVVVLTAREDLGTTIDASDLQLGVLKASSGAQRYAVPGGDGRRRNAFVFCEPFGVEVAKADLEPVP